MLTPISKSIQYGKHTLTIETGAIARQASGAVLVTMDDTSVLVTAVAKKNANPGQDFFPLTVDYVEKAYAAGRIPGGFLRREGRPSDNETLVARLIDRPIRPLFPEHFFNDVQIIAQVISSNPEVPADIVALIGASAALSISGVPFDGPIGAARVGFIDGQYVLNPTASEQSISKLELVVAGTEKAVLMVESQADVLSEEQMLGAVVFGHEQQQAVIRLIKELAQETGKERWITETPVVNQPLVDLIKAKATDGLVEAYTTVEKQIRQNKIEEVKTIVLEAVVAAYPEEDTRPSDKEVLKLIHDLEYDLVRQRILDNLPRIDGRDLTTVRALDIKVGVLARTHGSAIFTRGETQAIGVVTLGTDSDAQLIESLQGSYNDKFLFHYNFPPFSVGETGRFGSPKRREIGHGNLAKRGVMPVLPKDYPYTIRIVSEITESNGSSSMASVCAASLSLMDAGVPIDAPVAGIAMGLVKEGERFQVITDILGDEDHLGDMDFKVAGTSEGITALQMDIKIQGITKDIMQIALNQAKAARLHILSVMNRAISTSREDLSEFAPRIETLQIDAKKIKDVIGKGGSVIRNLIEQTKTSIDISDEGLISIASNVKADIEKAKEMIKNIVAEAEVNKIYLGKITKIVDFGAFVSIVGTKEGLLHISEISNERIENVADHLQEGQEIRVKVIEIDRQGKIRLSVKKIQDDE